MGTGMNGYGVGVGRSIGMCVGGSVGMGDGVGDGLSVGTATCKEIYMGTDTKTGMGTCMETDMERAKRVGLSAADWAVLEMLAGELDGASAADSLRFLLAEGLKRRMERGEPPMEPSFFDTLKPEAVAREYLDYIDAVLDRCGLLRPDGSLPTHYFAQVPTGGKWEADGMAGGWAVLDKRMRFTPDGYDREGCL